MLPAKRTGDIMTDEAGRKRNRLIAWLMIAIGLVAACEGFYAHMTTNGSDKIAQILLGTILVLLSCVFFIVSRKPKEPTA
jgi:uncharacterized membrane protein